MIESIALDEASLRTPEFSEGTAVRMADGRAWFFPRPIGVIRPTFKDGIAVELTSVPSFGANVDPYINAMQDDSLDDDGIGFARLRFTAAALLLLRNYSLTDTQLATLLELSFDDPVIVERWKAIERVFLSFPQSEDGATESQPSSDPAGQPASAE